jgi:hypothetical protein
MANGKNVGRLFPDCTNKYGHGEYHTFDNELEEGEVAVCRSCNRTFQLVNGELVEQMTKEVALAKLEMRRSVNTPKKIDNASLPAGAPMYYYCLGCDTLLAVKPEDWVDDPPPKYCGECEALKEAGWL